MRLVGLAELYPRQSVISLATKQNDLVAKLSFPSALSRSLVPQIAKLHCQLAIEFYVLVVYGQIDIIEATNTYMNLLLIKQLAFLAGK